MLGFCSDAGHYGELLEQFRLVEYPMLKDHTYLDHGGATLYAKSLIDESSRDLLQNLYGNPHSASAPSTRSSHRVSNVREKALRFLGADPRHFDLVFTANASAAIRLVADCFKDHTEAISTKFWYGYHADAHNSIVGVREAAPGSSRCFPDDASVEKWIEQREDAPLFEGQLTGLFAYPGQSNMTGRRLPFDWSRKIHAAFPEHGMYTLLDAAALASTGKIDLSNEADAPDFTVLSFYKIFGYPDLGALVVRKAAAAPLFDRKHFAGGTVEMVLTSKVWHAKKKVLYERLEDGTLPFHSIIALDTAIDVHQRLYGGMANISRHTSALARHAYKRLVDLRHPNGEPVIRFYNEHTHYGDPTLQGATITFNVTRFDGSYIGYEDFEVAANAHGIYVRSGAFCNPGGFARYLGFSADQLMTAFETGHRCNNPQQFVNHKVTGAVRVSLGAMSTRRDIDLLIKFVEETYIHEASKNAQGFNDDVRRDKQIAALDTSRPFIALL